MMTLNEIEYYYAPGDNEIKILTGNTTPMRKRYVQGIKYWKSQINQKPNRLLGEMTPSTLTVNGYFTGLNFNEKYLITRLKPPTHTDIMNVLCNFGELYNEITPRIIPPKKLSNSKRGRKKKVKKESRRRRQGTGKFFNSQITSAIFNPETCQFYKTKVFRNGKFQIPGSIKSDLTDTIYPLKVLRDYYAEELNITIGIEYIESVMRNCVCRLKNKKMRFYLQRVDEVIKGEKNKERSKKTIYNLMRPYGIPAVKNVLEFVGLYHTIDMAETQNNHERYFGYLIKFYRPIPANPDRKATIIILKSGKINIGGGNSMEEIMEIYYWFEMICTKYKNYIIYDPANEENETDNATGYDSIYDSE